MSDSRHITQYCHLISLICSTTRPARVKVSITQQPQPTSLEKAPDSSPPSKRGRHMVVFGLASSRRSHRLTLAYTKVLSALEEGGGSGVFSAGST